VLTASEDKNEFVQAMKLGCSGIVLKQTASDLIVKSIRKVNAGEIWLDSYTMAAVMRQFQTETDGNSYEPVKACDIQDMRRGSPSALGKAWITLNGFLSS
jgi:DNA-binding NarL/FixJ family response regulator